ncbi:hypothetical protein Pcac1_g19009 [Phytophthora cactorum]|uniref:Reverse transcriptase Ty1/copia-type domain-containing protein n=1 Tax=Phytophthora cactorum TaxID=29920 RepID=A0A8T0Z1P3_9STRA|nr:hypothetical protein Pcac1_g19009 [Phytophthora cactorum]KAG2810699.1 hypothetical protein PC112_g15940 [Phytophthora cactorum]KAG2823351.1 hypothetical protein PC111_g10258 [Phytophthora cactorum]KAG2855891.1 hypothetical protein PC113_g12060 [Phytophthora cactorum]KAG2936220.1 hypothetical protein PC117_g12156 [Phytophthora cactorum]
MLTIITRRGIDEAQQTTEWPQWQTAIEKEMRDLQANGRWEVMKVPAGANVVSSKWVFKVNFNSRGELEQFKARLVARGFHSDLVLTTKKPTRPC